MRSPAPLRRHKTPRARSGGFTLVELLVVVAAVAILASLLLPALAAARQRALATRSLSNVRQLGLGMNLYALDHGQLPRDPREPGSPDWVETLSLYAGNVDGLRTCPADPFRDARSKARSCSYVLNYYTSGGKPQHFSDPNGDTVFEIDPDRNVDTFPRPSETFLMFEVSNAGVRTDPGPLFDDHTHPDTWTLGWGHVTADIDPLRHGPGANFPLFLGCISVSNLFINKGGPCLPT